MQSKRIQAARFIPAALWYGVIFYFSSQTGESSTESSDSVLKILGYDLEHITVALANLLSLIVRKGAHISVFFVQAALLYYGFKGTAWKERSCLAATFAFCVILAGSDEFHQLFVPGRSGKIQDVLIDLTGSVVFLAVAWMVRKVRQSRG